MGTSSTGSVDPLHDLADQARQEDLWFHVDGADGAPARPAPSGEDLLAGIERTDSLVLDPHKWLFQPYEIGCVLVSHRGLLEHTFTLDGAYLRDTSGDHVQFRERGPQLTRSSRALKLWLSLTTFGLDAFRVALARGIELAEHAQRTLRSTGWEVTSPASPGVVTFRQSGATDAQTDALARRITESGYARPEHDRPERPHPGV